MSEESASEQPEDPVLEGPGPPPGTANEQATRSLERIELDRTSPSALLALDERAGVRQVVPAEPLVGTDGEGRPVLSVVAFLERQPRPDESVQSLLRDGTVRFDASLETPADLLADLACDYDAEFEPLYTTRTAFRLERDDGSTVATTDATGANPRASLGGTVGPADARAVFDALQSDTSSLDLVADVTYRTDAVPQRLRLRGNWAAIHDGFARRFDVGDEVPSGALRETLSQLVADGTLRVTLDGDGVSPEAAREDPVVSAFLRYAGVVLDRAYDGETVRLRERPAETFDLDATTTVETSGERTETLRTDLAAAFDAVLGDVDLDRYVNLVSLGGSRSDAVTSVPPLREVTDASRSGLPSTVRLAATDAGLQSVQLASTPSAGRATPVRLRDEVYTLDDRRRVTAFDDVRVVRPDDALESLPVVTDPTDNLWRDRRDPSRFWYAPGVEPVEPSAADDRETGPFAFEYERVGATADGEPALEGTVRFDLRLTMPPAVERELRQHEGAQAQPVPTDGLRVTLAIPFVDDDGETRTHRFQAETTREGDTVTAEVSLRNEWVRLAYGALGYADFQSEPARVVVTYTHRGVVPIRTSDYIVAYGAKSATTPVVYADRETVDRPVYFDARDATLHTRRASLSLARDASPASAASSPAPRLGTMRATDERSGSPRLSDVALSHGLRPEFVYRPELRRPDLDVVQPQVEYVTRTFAQEATSDLLYECRSLGPLYGRRTDQGVEAIGCRDALRLGETSYRQYEEVTALATDAYRVYRSLPQPNRFLVVPETYRITRYERGHDREYRPCAQVYALLTEDRAKDAFVVEATLQPDISAAERRRLGTRLTDYAPDPVVEYPTESMADATYAWSIAPVVDDPQVVERPVDLHVTVSAGLSQALLLKQMLEGDGISGRVTFAFDDGSTLASDLALDLANLTGPWDRGPVAVADDGDGVRLTNRVGTTVDVFDLDVYAEGERTTVPVGATLAPGDSTRVGTTGDTAEAYPVYDERPGDAGSLAETRIFVEDVETTVVFAAQFDLGDHGLASLGIEARIRDLPGTYETTLSGDPPVGNVDVTLPLTTFLDRHVLEYRVRKRSVDGTTQVTDWLAHDLQQDGTIVSLVWDHIAQ